MPEAEDRQSTWDIFLRAGQQIDQVVVDRLDMLDLVAAEAELQRLSVGDEALQRWVGWGRYKLAVAKAVLRRGSRELKVSGQPVW